MFNNFKLSPPWRGNGFFTKLKSHSPSNALAKFSWNRTTCSKDEDGNVKRLLQQQRRATDTSCSEILTWAFGPGELKQWHAKKYVFHILKRAYNPPPPSSKKQTNKQAKTKTKNKKKVAETI